MEKNTAEMRIERLVRNLFESGQIIQRDIIAIGLMPAIFIVEKAGIPARFTATCEEEVAYILLTEAYTIVWEFLKKQSRIPIFE